MKPENLQWLDLSFNLFTTIDPVLLNFQSLHVLYMHGNQIAKLPAVNKLQGLPKLRSFTMNGNPVESMKAYRRYVVGALPQLRSLDHASITEDEIAHAKAWYVGH